jgi:cupin fold WbuC family metalloprotein
VFVAEEDVVRVSRSDVSELKALAGGTPRKRARLCAHKDEGDLFQEMFIVHTKDTYVRPHKHLSKSESLHVLEGQADVLIYDEAGAVARAFRLGDYASGRRFYYRIPPGIYHSLIIRSGAFVFHEATTGPFDRSKSAFAPWSPEESDGAAVAAFLKRQGEAALSKMED